MISASTPRLWGRLRRLILAVPLLAALGFGLASCSSSPSVEVSSDTVVIDVRTPAEFAEGHLQGAVNIDLQSPNFAAEAAQLDPSGTYLVYCRSGNRSAQATSYLVQQGFSDVTDIGGLSAAASATGIAVVK